MSLLGLGRQPGQQRYSGQVSNLSITESVYSTTLPILFGTKRLHGKLLDYYGFNAQKQSAPTGKGIFGSKGDYFEYYATVVIALAQGPDQALLNVWTYNGMLENLSSTYSYTIPSGGGSVQPVQGNAAPIQFDLGVTYQAPYSVATNDFGGAPKTLTGMQNVPMVKVTGTPGAGQYAFDLATGTYLFAAADVGHPITITYSSTFSLYYFIQTQFDIVPGPPYQISPDNHDYFYQDLGVTFVDNNTAGILVSGTPSATNEYQVTIGYYNFFSGDSGRPVAIKYSFTSSDSTVSSSSVLNLTFFPGQRGQAPWSYSESANPSHAFGYTGICYVASENLDLGQTAQMPPYNYEVAGQCIMPGQQDCNLCDVIQLLLTDSLCGIDFPISALDLSGTWPIARACWNANNFFISDVLEASGGIADLLKKYCDAGNTAAFFSGGLLKLVPYSEVSAVGNGSIYTPPTTPVAYLTWDDILLPSGQKPGNSLSDDFIPWDEVAAVDKYNYVQANWSQRINSYNNNLVNLQNDAAIALYNRRMESAQDWTFICIPQAVQWALGCRLSRGLYVDKKAKLSLPYTFDWLEPMDVVVLPTGIPVRVTKIDEDENQVQSIEAENFVYGASNASLYPVTNPNRYQPTQATDDPGSTFPAFFQTTQTQNGGVSNQLSIAAAGDSDNWGGCQIWLSVDGEDGDYSKIGTVDEICALGVLTAALPANPDPDTTDTLSVDMSASQTQLTSASQAVADSFGTLCALISPNGNLVEFISYQTASLTGTNRYNLTYLRRGVYGTPISAFPPGSSFVYIGSYNIFSYTFQLQYIGAVCYMKFPAFNLTRSYIQPLTQCKAYEVIPGLTGAAVNEQYVPSANTVTADAYGTVTNPTEAYDKNFETSAVITENVPSGSHGSSQVLYSGFPSQVLQQAAGLYINYENMSGGSGLGTGPALQIEVSLNGGTSFFPIAGQTNGSNSVSEGTAATFLPVGLNIDQVQVLITASTAGISGGLASVGIVEIWIQ